MFKCPKYNDKEWLFEQYWILGKSMQKIAKEIDVNKGTINTWLRKFDIKIKRLSDYRIPHKTIDGIEHKYCNKCNRYLPYKAFHENIIKRDLERKGRTYNFCKECLKNQYEERKRKNPNYYLKKQIEKDFEISFEEYIKMNKNQNGKCFFCGRKEIAKNGYGKIKRLTIHENPENKKVLCLACSRCNMAMGLLSHNPFILIKMIKTKFGKKRDDI